MLYFKDDFFAGFVREEKMMEFLTELEERAEWHRISADKLEIFPIEEGTCIDVEVEEEESKEIVKDTCRHTGLMVRFEKGTYPVGNTAMKTLENRARISGKALSLLPKEKLARILNECLEVSGGTALVRIGEGKVRAAHSGAYKVLPMPQIFHIASESIHENYREVQFAGGSFEQSRATARWEIRDRELLETYEKLMATYEGRCPQLAAQIRVTTSDTADSGANIFYHLLVGPGKRRIAMGMAVKMEHEGQNSVERFAENLETTFSRYREAACKLERLTHVQISYPLNVMHGMLQNIRMPAELREETMNLFMNTNGEVAVTEGALKAYCAWCFSGKPFIGIPGVGQTACLESFLQEKERSGLRVLECMDMDKWMPVVCDRKERHCLDCASERKGKVCCHKERKRDNIQKGCSRLYRTCGEHRIPCRRGTWHMDQRGLWDGRWELLHDDAGICKLCRGQDTGPGIFDRTGTVPEVQGHGWGSMYRSSLYIVR